MRSTTRVHNNAHIASYLLNQVCAGQGQCTLGFLKLILCELLIYMFECVCVSVACVCMYMHACMHVLTCQLLLYLLKISDHANLLTTEEQ